MFFLYNGKFPGVATMVNEEAWPAGVTTGLIPFKKKEKKIIRGSNVPLKLYLLYTTDPQTSKLPCS